MYRLFILVLFFAPIAFAQATLTPVERFEADSSIIFPKGTQRLDQQACFDLMASTFQRFRGKAEVQGFGCYVRRSRVSHNELLTSFEAALARAGYQKAAENLISQKHLAQAWVTNNLALSVEHVLDQMGLVSYLTLVTDSQNSTVDSMSPVDALEFDPAVVLPRTALLNEGGTCKTSVQNVLSFIESMGRSTYGLDEYHCYLIYTDNWRSAAQEVMDSLEQANYQGRTFTKDHLPISYQWWTHEASRQRLAFVFAPEGTRRGLYIVAFRY